MPSFAVLPAQQRFEAFDPAAFDIDLRLIVQEKLLAIEGTGQARLERQAARCRTLRDESVQHVLLVVFPGRLERRFGVLHQGVGRIRVMRIEGEPGADRDPQFMAVDIEGLDEGLRRRVLHDPSGVRRAAHLGEHHGKGAAAEVRHAFGIRVRLLEPRRHLLDQPVAHVAAERIVDGAQFLHIEHHDGAAVAVGGVVSQALRQALTEERPLGEAGQAVEIRQKVNGFVLVEVLKRKTQIGGQFQQNAQFGLVENLALRAVQRDHADRRCRR